MKKRLMSAVSIGALLAAAVPGATLAQDASWTVVTEGLDAPRGLEFGPDGTLYVAIAGSGGDECFEAPGPEGPEMMDICVGATGSVTAIDVTTGEATEVVPGLPSTHIEVEGVLGPPDVAIADDGTIYVLTADGNVPDAEERAEGDIGGIVWMVGEDGAPVQIADLVEYEASANPDGGVVDSNPNGIAVAPDGSLLVADAGANAIFMIDAEGETTTVATFADTMVEAPMMPEGEGEAAEGGEAPAEGGEAPAEGGEEAAEGGEPAMMPMQQVPTHVTIGPDGAAYVTFLRGFPFAPGSAWVARIAEGEEPTAYAEGLTNVVGSAFASDGTLYVVEMFTNGMMSGDPTGALKAIPPGGGEVVTVATEGLITPGGVAVSAADEVFVSNGSAQPGGGSIVKLDQ
ncbi:MAG: ScyD/ScyE family protein [Candidatus Limnocylindrales bacterium]